MLWSYRPLFGSQSETSKNLEFSSFEVIELVGILVLTPDSSSPKLELPGTLFRSKMPNREVAELRPSLLGVQP